MFHFIKRTASSIANASAGKVRLWADTDGTFKAKDDAGVVKTLGNGIASIAQTGTNGLVDTYRITRDDGSSSTFEVKNGRGIVSIQAPATPGQPNTTDTYTIQYNDGTTSTYVVRNGRDGIDGQGQPATNAPAKIDPDDAASVGTRTAFYALEDHQHQIDAAAPTTNLTAATSNAEGTAASFARSDHSHAITTGTAVALGATASAGTSASLARADHVHPYPTAANVGADPAGTASSAVAAHEAAADPHPQYTTTAEAAAAAPVQSVNGQTGAVTIVTPPSTNNTAVSNTARGAAFSTAVTTVASLPIAGGSVQPGDTYFFRIRAQVTNTTTATNLVATIAVGATAVITITQALGTTARTNQPVTIEGYLLFLSATSAEADVRALTKAAVAFDAIAATAASVAVSTAADTDVNMKVNTSGATSTVTLVQALIIKEK